MTAFLVFTGLEDLSFFYRLINIQIVQRYFRFHTCFSCEGKYSRKFEELPHLIKKISSCFFFFFFFANSINSMQWFHIQFRIFRCCIYIAFQYLTTFHSYLFICGLIFGEFLISLWNFFYIIFYEEYKTFTILIFLFSFLVLISILNFLCLRIFDLFYFWSKDKIFPQN